MTKSKASKKLQFVVWIFMFLEIKSRKMYLSLWINLRVKLRIGEIKLKMLFSLRCLILFSLKINVFRLKIHQKVIYKKIADKSKMQRKITIMFNHNMLTAEP